MASVVAEARAGMASRTTEAVELVADVVQRPVETGDLPAQAGSRVGVARQVDGAGAGASQPGLGQGQCHQVLVSGQIHHAHGGLAVAERHVPALGELVAGEGDLQEDLVGRGTCSEDDCHVRKDQGGPWNREPPTSGRYRSVR